MVSRTLRTPSSASSCSTKDLRRRRRISLIFEQSREDEMNTQTHEILSISLGLRGLPLRRMDPSEAKTFRVDMRSRSVDFPERSEER